MDMDRQGIDRLIEKAGLMPSGRTAKKLRDAFEAESKREAEAEHDKSGSGREPTHRATRGHGPARPPERKRLTL